MLEVDADRPPVAVEHGHTAGIEATLDRLDPVHPHDVGTHVGEEHRSERTRPDPDQLDDRDALQWSRHELPSPCVGP